MPPTRTTWTDDDGTGTTGTIILNARLQDVYQALDNFFCATNAGNTAGITLNQGAADDEILSLLSSDVAHGITGIAVTSAFGTAAKFSATAGGLRLRGLSEADTGVAIHADVTTTDGTRTTGSHGGVRILSSLKSGTAEASMGADKNLVSIEDNGTTKFIFDSDGDSHEDGTGWTAYDDHDDLALIEALEYELTAAQGNPIDRHFSHWMTERRDTLQRLGLVTFNEDGHHFVNRSRMQNLLCGAIRQQARELQKLKTHMGLLN